jgi:hypothetical protein
MQPGLGTAGAIHGCVNRPSSDPHLSQNIFPRFLSVAAKLALSLDWPRLHPTQARLNGLQSLEDFIAVCSSAHQPRASIADRSRFCSGWVACRRTGIADLMNCKLQGRSTPATNLSRSHTETCEQCQAMQANAIPEGIRTL